MRKFTYFATIVLFAGLFSSCENGGNDLGDIQFKRMHLDGVKVLALASDGSDEQKAPRRAPAEEGEGEIVYDMSEPAYSVSEDGTLVEITYTIECRGRGEVIEKVKANMRLKMENIFSIGDDWLWLYSCYYDYPDLDKLEDPYRSMIKHKIDNFYGNFLVRKKDGALFYWDARDGRPIYTNEGVPFYQQSDLYSVVECINGEIYSNCWHLASYGQMLYRLKDEGSQLAVTKMHNNTLFSTSIAPDDRGVIGLDIFYEGVNGSSPGILFINDNLDITNIEEPENDPTLQGVSGLQWAFISIQNTLYAVATFYKQNRPQAAFYSVRIDEAQTRVFADELLALSSDAPNLSSFGVCRVSKKETFSWLDARYKHTFDPQAKKVVSDALPEHYPSDYTDYYNDVAYVMSSDERTIYICDMAKDRAEEVVLDWSEYDAFKSKLAPSTIKPFEDYNPRTQSFVKTALTMNGQKVTIMVDVFGENKGKVRVYKAGDTTAGQVISVMVRLN